MTLLYVKTKLLCLKEVLVYQLKPPKVCQMTNKVCNSADDSEFANKNCWPLSLLAIPH